jgi:hypothetical protein
MDIATFATGFGLTIGLIAVLLMFAVPVVIVIAILAYKTKKARILSETASKFAEKGLPLPAQLQIAPLVAPNADRRRGIILIALGLGLCAFFYVINPEDTTWGIGIIPLVVGLGYLLAWAIEKNRDGA